MTNSPGIFFEKLGNLQFIETYWRVVTFINISNLNVQVNSALKAETYFETCLRNNPNFRSKYSSDFKPINSNLIVSIKKKFSSITSLLYHKIKKRSLFDLGGKILKFTFGNLDVEDAKYYDEVISELSKNQVNSYSLVENQAKIISKSINLENRTLTQISSRIDKIFNQITNSELNSNTSKRITAFNFELERFHTELIILEHELDQLTDSILFVKNNVLHPFILTPDQFLNELIESLRHIPQDLSFPIKLEINDIPILLKVIKIQTALINNKIIFSISIPLINNVHFDLFKLYPLPTKIKNSYSYIQPDFEFLVYSEIKNLYSHLDTLDSCSEIKKTNFICPFKNPLTNIQLEPICETEILNSINEFPKSCKALNIKHDKEIWHQLINKNIWIYLVPQPTRLTIKCNSNKTFVEILTDSGIITFEKDCIAHTSKNRIETYQEYNKELEIIIPNLNIQLDNIFTFNFSHINFNLTNRIIKPNKILDLSYFNTLSNELKLHQTYIESFQNTPVLNKDLFNGFQSFLVSFVFFVFSILLIVLTFVILSRRINSLMEKLVLSGIQMTTVVRKRKRSRDSE